MNYLTCPSLQDLADCEPPAFGTPAASKRIAPPPWVNLASTVAHTSTSGRIPGIIEDLIATINSRGIVEGIYRVPGDRRATSQLIERYFNDPRRKRLGIYTIASIHTCGSALKQFFRELDEPLLTFDGYNNFVQATKVRSWCFFCWRGLTANSCLSVGRSTVTVRCDHCRTGQTAVVQFLYTSGTY